MIKKNYFWGLGILVLVVSMVAISGCTSNTTQKLNYTNNVISFQYPSDFSNGTKGGDISSGDSNWTDVVYLVNNQGINIYVDKYPNIETILTPQVVAQETLNSRKQLSGGAILSSARQTNPNGIEMWNTISTLDNPSDGTPLVYYDTYFMAGNDMYSISVYGDKSKQEDIQTVAESVFNSTSINKG